MAPAVLDAPASASTEIASKPRDYSHLKQYQFQPGHEKVGQVGRPKGSKSFSTILQHAAPKLAQAYVRHAMKGSATLLVDSRKVFYPIDTDGSDGGSPTVQINFVGAMLRADPPPVDPTKGV